MDTSDHPRLDDSGQPMTEDRPIYVRQRVLDVARTPTFAVTNDFIEYKGRRLTPEILDRLIALAG
jgi:hypothetical protein